MCRGACAIPCFCSQHPSFAPGSLDVTVGFLVFLYLVHNLPQLHMHIVIYSSLQFLYILLLKEMFVQMTELQQRVPGPSLSQKEEGKIEKENMESKRTGRKCSGRGRKQKGKKCGNWKCG